MALLQQQHQSLEVVYCILLIQNHYLNEISKERVLSNMATFFLSGGLGLANTSLGGGLKLGGGELSLFRIDDLDSLYQF